MRTDHIKRPRDAAAEAARAAAYERKQRWKEQPGNRYTPDELREMAESIGPIRIADQEPHVMRLD
ncbi:MAG: hypothetical protein AAB676_21155 [Verrucomicrobiota bacterium]